MLLARNRGTRGRQAGIPSNAYADSAIRVAFALAAGHRSTDELVDATGLSRSIVAGYVLTLRDLGLVETGPGKQRTTRPRFRFVTPGGS